MKRMTYFVMAMALVLGFTQCKKEQLLEPQGGQVRITLDVKNGGKATDGTRVNVNDNHVTFEKGDKILVGYNNAYVGTLTHNGEQFSGSIDATVTGTQKLYFYFVGNKNTGTLTAGSTTSCDVDVSDQTKELPVLSFSESDEDFTGSGSYTASLHNQCALVKFTLDNPAGSIMVGNMHTKATISFSNPSITPIEETTGLVRLYSKTDTEKWAILLPQPAIDNASVIIGSQNLTVDVPSINANDYITSISTIENDASSLVSLAGLSANYIAKDGDILTGTLDGANNADQRVKISIADGATITLRDAHILGCMSWDRYQWAGLNCDGDATIILEDGTTNKVQGSNYQYPGIYIPANKTLTINAKGSGTGTLDARCMAEAQGGAGIGAIAQVSSTYAGYYPCGNIVINGGVITATGAPGNNGSSQLPGGAGIGGALNESCGTITINGGIVTANGGLYCPGIGTGSGAVSGGVSACGAIEINGGTVTANGGQYAAGIGAGYNTIANKTCSCSTITINGGTVNATGGENGAGIGSGYANNNRNKTTSSCGDIRITGGTVTAIGGDNGAGIGTGYKNGNRAVSQCGSITIGAGVTSVTATKGTGATNSIGVGKVGTCGTVTIEDPTKVTQN